jgi:hypothetical protein
MTERVDGSCLCGQIEFHAILPALFCAHCHCSMCRRGHGAAYVTWFAVPYDRFVIDAGADALIRYPSSDHGTRTFCGRCGSSLFCESTERSDHIDIVLANMHSAIDKAPQAHAYFDDRAGWTELGDELPRLGGGSGMEPIPG